MRIDNIDVLSVRETALRQLLGLDKDAEGNITVSISSILPVSALRNLVDVAAIEDNQVAKAQRRLETITKCGDLQSATIAMEPVALDTDDPLHCSDIQLTITVVDWKIEQDPRKIDRVICKANRSCRKLKDASMQTEDSLDTIDKYGRVMTYSKVDESWKTVITNRVPKSFHCVFCPEMVFETTHALGDHNKEYGHMLEGNFKKSKSTLSNKSTNLADRPAGSQVGADSPSKAKASSIQSSADENTTMFDCPFCQLKFTKHTGLYAHLRKRHHGDVGRMAARMRKRKRNEPPLAPVEKVINTIQCDYCSIKCYDSRELYSHTREAHPEFFTDIDAYATHEDEITRIEAGNMDELQKSADVNITIPAVCTETQYVEEAIDDVPTVHAASTTTTTTTTCTELKAILGDDGVYRIVLEEM